MTSPIKDVLKVLFQHADVIEEALQGVIGKEGHGSEAAIMALRSVEALRPAGVDGYRLHPKLREFLTDHLQLFPAYQSLAEIHSRISQAKQLWDEAQDLLRARDAEGVETIVDTLESTVFDIGDSVDRNLQYLQMLISTRFGNVRTLEAKKSQNRYYQVQTNTLAQDMARMGRVFDTIEREATTRGMPDLAKFIRVNLSARTLGWQNSMSEMQTHISLEIFRIREVELNHKQLARLDVFLRQQPMWRGFEVDTTKPVPDFLLAARLPDLEAHVEPLDTDNQIVDVLAKEAYSLPPRQVAGPPKEVRRYERVVDAPRVEKPTDAAIALQRLVAAAQASTEPMSLAAWRLTDDLAQTVDAHVWLVFAVLALRDRRITVEVVSSSPRPGERFRHFFEDARVMPPGGPR